MMAYLNDDTFSAADWGDAQKILQLILLCGRLEVRHVAVFEVCLPFVSKAIKCEGISRDVRNKMRALFTRPYASHNSNSELDSGRMCSNSYVINVGNGTNQLSGSKFARSYFNGGMLVGLPHSNYGSSFKYLVDEYRKSDGKFLRNFNSYMMSLESHHNETLLKRWQYAYKSCDDVDYARRQRCVQLPEDYIKHFSREGLRKKEWLNSTKDCKFFRRDKARGAAKFIAGIQKDSLSYAYLLSAIMRTAFEKQVYEESEQNGLTVDVGCVIGAANGKETRVVILYVTGGTIVHIRPCEHNAKIHAPEIGEKLKQYL